jgi:ribonuclease III
MHYDVNARRRFLILVSAIGSFIQVAPAMSLEEQLGYHFVDKRYLARALTRKAHALELKQRHIDCADQEIYRTLGDAVLKAILIEFLISHGASSRKEITTRKIELEREENLALIGQRIGLGAALKLGVGEQQQGADKQPYVLAESLEAVIGAVYLDGGFNCARKTIKHLFKEVFPHA